MTFDPLHRWPEVEPWLDQALGLAPAERDTFLESEIEDPEIRERVRGLLERADMHSAEGASPALARLASALDSAPEIPDDSLVGPYRVTRTLGVGGMARVVLAHREQDSLRRQVALKIQHAALADKASQRRFLAEGQLLHELDHPGIARLLDSGFLDGEPPRPYLVLEYIEGVAIDQYCREQQLGLRELIVLFVSAARAVEFAHRHLVVHRDLKPSNLLVTAEGQSKLLDFGIAKVLADAELSLHREATPVTMTHQMLLTPAYAAPEQLNGETVTTHTDVWGLGVVLHELLTGDRLFSGHPTEIARQIRQGKVAAPSAALTQETQNDRRWSAADLLGDLDTIVGKALREAPEERYASAGAMADDLDRYLANLPIQARRQTARYRLSRFVRRNRLAVAMASVLAVASLLLTMLLVRQFFETSRERDRADVQRATAERERDRAQEVSQFLEGLFEAADPNVNLGAESTVGQLLDRGASRVATLDSHPITRAQIATVLGNVLRELDRHQEALDLLKTAESSASEALAVGNLDSETEFVELTQTLVTVKTDLGAALYQMDQISDAEAHFQEALDLEPSAQFPPSSDVRLDLLSALALMAQSRSERDLALERYQQALVAMPEKPTETSLVVRYNYGAALQQFGSLEDARAVLEPTVQQARELHGRIHPFPAKVASLLGSVLVRLGEDAAAEPLLAYGVEVQRSVFGEGSWELARALNSQAELLRKRGDFDGSVAAYQEVATTVAAVFGPQHHTVAISRGSLCLSLVMADRSSEALEECETSLRVARQLADADRLTGLALRFRGLAKATLDQLPEARKDLDQAIEAFSAAAGPDSAVAAPSYSDSAAVKLLLNDTLAAKQAAQRSLDLLEPNGTEAQTVANQLWLLLADCDPQAKEQETLLRALLPPGHYTLRLLDAINSSGLCVLG